MSAAYSAPVDISLPRIAHGPDDLIGILGIQRYQRVAAFAVDVRESLGHLVGELLQGTEESQLCGTITRPLDEPLHLRPGYGPPPHKYHHSRLETGLRSSAQNLRTTYRCWSKCDMQMG